MDHALYRQLGKNLFQARKRAGLTQLEVAKAIGLTRGSIANVERGHQRIHVDTLVGLARVVGAQPGDLLPREVSVQVDGRVLRKYPDDVQALVRRVAAGSKPDV